MKQYIRVIATLLAIILVFTACGSSSSSNELEENVQSEVQNMDGEAEHFETDINEDSIVTEEDNVIDEAENEPEITLGKEKVVIQTYEPQRQVDEITAADLSVPADFDPNGTVIVIDAGHQGKGNSQKEPDGPGSSVLKAKVTSGATGCVTKQQEYVLNLQVALKLRDELKARGYQVVMIREDHAINISNSERAKFANSLEADAFIRIHANSSDNSSVSGVETICQTASNPYNAHLYADSRRLSDCILEEFVESTGAKKRRVWETDTMSGINWCEVPVTILEMGFLSNPEEDRLMASDDYQNKMVQGIANGLDKFFGR